MRAFSLCNLHTAFGINQLLWCHALMVISSSLPPPPPLRACSLICQHCFVPLAYRLDGPWMRAFSLYNLHTAFGIDSKVEEQLQPGITISKPGPLAPLVQSIHSAIVDTGEKRGRGTYFHGQGRLFQHCVSLSHC
jgi:hypothetical protein